MAHVPVNYALTGGELRYILDQSGARALLTSPALEINLDGIIVVIRGRFDGGGELDVLATALDRSAAPEVEICRSTSAWLAQIVYTSGTTAAPKGAMMTHRAMLSQYYSVIHEMDFSAEDRALGALPGVLDTAQMHAFTIPQMLVGGRTVLIEAPVLEQVLRLIEQERITSFFAPPTVWISLRHPDFASV